MTKTIQHKGYIGELELDVDAGVIHGEVINTQAVLTFEGDTIAEAKAAFVDTVEDYLAWCKERGADPEKPFSGTLSLRIGHALHREVATAARRQHQSINSFITMALEVAVGQAVQPSHPIRTAVPNSVADWYSATLSEEVERHRVKPQATPILEIRQFSARVQ